MDNTTDNPTDKTPPQKKVILRADLQPAVSKYCNKCQKEHPISAFDLHPRTRDGLKTSCRACVSAYNKNRYAANRELMKRQAMEWQKNNLHRTAGYKHTYYKKLKIQELLTETPTSNIVKSDETLPTTLPVVDPAP